MGISHTLVEEIWTRAIKVYGYDGSVWRVDSFGSPILHDDYANRGSRYGWVVARVRSACAQKEDSAADFRAVQWQNV